MYQLLEERSSYQISLRIFLVVSLYWIVSITTVFVNKALLTTQESNLEAPVFITWYQCLVSATICFTMSKLSKIFPETVSFPESNVFSYATFTKVLPLSFLFMAMIVMNNLCLKYVSVAYYYVGRSLTTVFNVLFTYLLLQQKTSMRCIICCAVIVFGFWLGVDQESLTESFSWRGTIYGILGSASLALYTIYTKKVLPHVNQEIWLLSYYNNLYSSLILIPVIVANGEFWNIVNYQSISSTGFWAIMSFGGLCGFSIGFVTALQIKVTSPLTHNISGTAKACAQTVIATQWYHESKSFLWWLSNIIVLFGSACYARVRQIEMDNNRKAAMIPTTVEKKLPLNHREKI
uniref:Putative gdp-fucose transporter n=1 Tax=Tabanus bromius TaxID=304241 RepID=A0A0K8TRY9_TABBR